MAITIVFPEFILSKAICDLRLALHELREFKEYLRSDKNNLKWRALYKTWDAGEEEEWSWTVEDPPHHKWLYRLLFLEPPRENRGEALSSSHGTENEDVELKTLHNNEEEHGQGEMEQQEQLDETAHGPQNLATGLEQDLEAGGGSRGSSDRGRESSPSNNSGRPQMAPRMEQRIQIWTIVHSYFAQMGGLAYISREDRNDYFALTASKLTLRYSWLGTHPLKHLNLGREDIEDKSKADWFVKSIAVLQIGWLVLNVIARAVKKLPITQIEVATIAFAVMAILTYAINWWKPKDVSQPIRLLHSGVGTSLHSHETVDLMQSFMIRLRRPHKAAAKSRDIPDLKRMPNDLVWMEGQTPLFYHLLGFSSLVFGSLHCIAWNFQFPTRTELLCWRVASLLSATLPGIALGLSMVLGYLRTDVLGRKRTALFLHELRPLEMLSISEERWRYLGWPRFREWHHEAEGAFVAMTQDPNTDWEAGPSQEIIEELRKSEKGADPSLLISSFAVTILKFRQNWLRRHSQENHHIHFAQDWIDGCKAMSDLFRQYTDELDFKNVWRGYEGFVERKLGVPPASQPDTSCVEMIIKAYENTITKIGALESRLDIATKIVEGLNWCGGVIYIACRLMTIVLLFTCLRAAPAGVYQVVRWTTFIPGVS
jgi:hypothetical protein